jgi:glutamate synthase (NADPH/NADH)
VVNYFFHVAEEARELMAQLGIRKIDDLIGRTDLLDVRKGIEHWKAKGLDFSRVFAMPKMPAGVAVRHSESQSHGLEKALDNRLIELARPALEHGQAVTIETPIRNINRTVGTMLSYEIASRYGHEGLPDDTIHIRLAGSAGQSFGAFLAKGVTLDLVGDTNDYCGKGLSGGRISVQPSNKFRGEPTENIITGNVVLYGAIAGEAYFRGVAGERFAVRNSGARAVVEGVGDHGCEYMTGGTVVVLGTTGRNFAAGMSGGFRLRARPRRRIRQALQPGDGRPRSDHGFRGRVGAQAPDREPPEVHRLEARRGDPGRLGAVPREVRQGLPERVPPRPGRARSEESRSLAMGKVTGFMEFARLEEPHEEKESRKKHYREFYARLSDADAATQGARCMDCGIPFCMSGCPVNNIIPDWNDLVYRGDWKNAIDTLHSTNNFPEFTGRICPAPCEEACVLRINSDAVGIKSIEHAIIDKAWEEGWVRAQPAAHKTGKKVAVVGSGGAGLACAQQLARAGHDVTVFEKSDRIGGLLRYGIPDFKLEKR